MSGLTRDDVAHVAALARLELTDEELDRYTAQLAAVLDHAEDLAAFDLADDPADRAPLRASTPSCARTSSSRASTATRCSPRRPRVEDDRFCVPRIIGEAP